MYALSLVILLLTAMLVLVFGVPWYQRHKAKYKLNDATVFGVYYGVLGGLLVVHAVLFWQTENNRIYPEMAALVGAALGWLIGMWLSPLGSTESTKFAKYWTVVGVGSGFTLKWLIERLGDNKAWIAGHPFPCLIFSVSLALTTAAVYSTRAYNSALLIAPRKPLDDGVVLKDDYVEVKVNSTVRFYAAVVGANDPASHWEVLPAALGTIAADGTLTTGPAPVQGRITAFNLEDPTLSNCIDIHVV